MKELTAENVTFITKDCLFKDDIPQEELLKKAVIVHGIVNKWGFVPEKLEEHKTEIIEMLAQLPVEFQEKLGGGWSFLNACVRRDGVQWAEHPTMDMLFSLGQAVGAVQCLMPREMWSLLPGGMPYYQVKLP
jgi:hypothetical protein